MATRNGTPPQRRNRPHALHPVRPSAPPRNTRGPKSAQARRDEIRSLSKDAAQNGDTGVRAKDLIHALNARYAELLQDWDSVPEIDFNQRMFTLQHLTRSIAVLRRLDLLREKERNNSKSASSRSSRASATNESIPQNRAGSQSASPTAEGAPKCGAGFQPASAAHSDESDLSDPSDPIAAENPDRIPEESALQTGSPAPACSQNANTASEISAIPSASAPTPSEHPQSHPIPPTNYSQFPSNSKDRRSRFGLL